MATVVVVERVWVAAECKWVDQKGYEIVAEPVSFDTGEAHVELGGRLLAIKDGDVYQLFDKQLGPTFEGLWGGCTFHLVVRSW